jgi:hypothetical protein
MQVPPNKAMPATGGQSGIADTTAPRDPSREAQAALHFWQALEYLAPQSPPDVDAAEFVWELGTGSSDANMPWRDVTKQDILKKANLHWRFQIFSGIAAGDSLVEEARLALGALALDSSERKAPTPAACVVLEASGAGMATGQVFVSTVPWAMARITKHAGKIGPINFRGFFGNGGLQEEIRLKVKDLLVERKLLPPPSPGSDTAAATQIGAAPLTLDLAARSGPADAAGPDAQDTGNSQSVAPSPADSSELRPITAADIDAVTSLVFDLCGWTPTQQMRWRVKGVNASEKSAEQRKPSDDPLNSFYAEDLERVTDALQRDDIGPGLRAYLKGEDTPDRIDLENRVDSLIDGVHPSLFPHGCWPAEHPLVTAQQFAVNTMMRELAAGSGIFSVNGPPGTGKTTMLKDIVAAVVVSRADVLVTMADPLAAFKSKLEIENYGFPAFALADELRGFGIVVASANNGAVENISKELPGVNAIAGEIDLDYFSIVADSVVISGKNKGRSAARERWGLIAAVMGNKTNRAQFASQFWFADPALKPKKGEENNLPPPNPLRPRSIQSLIRNGDHGALPWEDARKRYLAAQEKVSVLIGQAAGGVRALEESRAAIHLKKSAGTSLKARTTQMPLLQAAVPATIHAQRIAEETVRRVLVQLQACRVIEQAQDEADKGAAKLSALELEMPEGGRFAATAAQNRAAQQQSELEKQYDKHMGRQPGLIAQIFRTSFSKRWNATGEMLERQIDGALARAKSTKDVVERAEAVTRMIADIGVAAKSIQERLQRARATAQAAGVSPSDTVTILERECQACQCNAAIAGQAASNARAAVDAAEREIRKCDAVIAGANAEIARNNAIVDALQLREPGSWNLAQLDRDSLHRAAPYAMPALFEARRDVFVAAMELHKAFIVASWRRLGPTLGAFINLLSGNISPGQVSKGAIHLWDAFFLVVPLISTTFASFPRLFAGLGREELAWLLIDEAGQAAPQQAVGAIWRSKRSVVVGDPLQLEPVVGVPEEIIGPMLARCSAEKQWAPPQASAQVLADRANRHGTPRQAR